MDDFNQGVYSNVDQLYTADDYGNLRVWNAESRELLKNYESAHYGAITSIALSKNEKYLFTGSEYGALIQWDAKKGELIAEWFDNKETPHDTEINTLFFPTENIMQSACNLGKLKVWDTENFCQMCEIKLDERFAIKCIDSTVDGQALFAGDVKGNIKQFFLKSAYLYENFSEMHESSILAIKVFKDEYIFSGDRFGYLRQWKLVKKSKEQQNANPKLAAFYDFELFNDYGKVLEGMFTELKFTSNYEYLLFSGGLGNLKRLKIEYDHDGKYTDKFKTLETYTKGIANDKDFYHAFSEAHIGPISSISISDNDEIFTTGHKGHIKSWSLKTQNIVVDWGKVHDTRITGAVITHKKKGNLNMNSEKQL